MVSEAVDSSLAPSYGIRHGESILWAHLQTPPVIKECPRRVLLEAILSCYNVNCRSGDHFVDPWGWYERGFGMHWGESSRFSSANIVTPTYEADYDAAGSVSDDCEELSFPTKSTGSRSVLTSCVNRMSGQRYWSSSVCHEIIRAVNSDQCKTSSDSDSLSQFASALARHYLEDLD